MGDNGGYLDAPPCLPDDGSQLHLPVHLLGGGRGAVGSVGVTLVMGGDTQRGAGVTLLSSGSTMSSKGPVMALGNLLKMMGSAGTRACCSPQWSW